MLYILKIKVSGYKLLDDNFEIDMTTKSRVYESDKLIEVEEIDKKLYRPRSIAIVGRNSSGKSTTLYLIRNALLLLKSGRWSYSKNAFRTDKIKLEILFYLNRFLYKYNVILGKNDDNANNDKEKYCQILHEELYELKYNRAVDIENIDYIEKKGKNISERLNQSLFDTSAITNLTRNNVFVDSFSTNILSGNISVLTGSFFECLKNCNSKLSSSIIRLLDNSIEYISCDDSELVTFKRTNKPEQVVKKEVQKK